MNSNAWRETVTSRSFALADLSVVVASGTALCLVPQIGFWAIAASLLSWTIRILVGAAPFRRSGFNWFVALFLLSAITGLWASYNRAAAYDKFALIVMSILLYYVLGSQPQENFVWVSIGLFCVGVGVSIYFFLTHDFIASPRKLELVNAVGRWMMANRVFTGWQPIHPNYVSGIAAIATPYIAHAGWMINKGAKRKIVPVLSLIIGLGVNLFALLMATSRGAFMAIASALGIVLMGMVARPSMVNPKFRFDAIFPVAVLGSLVAIIMVLFAGPAQAGGSVSERYHFGTGSRAELFVRSAYLISDFPFTGGGLAAFPGLYSHYMLVIPHYNVPNSHNLFLDVFIEQGIAGGISFFALYLVGIWRVSRSIAFAQSFEMNLFGWATLGSLIIAFTHGMVDDYLYDGKGATLSLALIGISVAFSRSLPPTIQSTGINWNLSKRSLSVVGILLASFCFLNINRIHSLWRSNMGAVRMAQEELVGFPTGVWAGSELAAQLDFAEEEFLASLKADPSNRTANHRLGLIANLRRDFSSAVAFYEIARLQSSNHRGIIKSLGFAYVWNGNLDKAQAFLTFVPEATDELDSYIWYWDSQNLPELSSYAIAMKNALGATPLQPR
ncbi:MAG: O-antigen ligase family protein [Anaerolineales bacterium]|nr:O-antigen ligase family protein [Anaerolineales bacterium]